MINRKIKQDTMFEDADFDSTVSGVIWVQGRIAKYAKTWKLVEVATAKHPGTAQPYWFGLTFEPLPVTEKGPSTAA